MTWKLLVNYQAILFAGLKYQLKKMPSSEYFKFQNFHIKMSHKMQLSLGRVELCFYCLITFHIFEISFLRQVVAFRQIYLNLLN